MDEQKLRQMAEVAGRVAFEAAYQACQGSHEEAMWAGHNAYIAAVGETY